MNFETLQNFGGELNPLKTEDIKNELLKERKVEVLELIESNNTDEAFKIIHELNEGDFKWEDGMQRKLMNHHFDNAKNSPEEAQAAIQEIIGRTQKKQSQQGRISKYNQNFEKSYSGPLSEDGFIENPKSPSDFFNNAVETDNTAEAERILVEIRDLGDNKKTDHREKPLFDYYGENGEHDNAMTLIDSMVENDHNKKYNSKQGRLDHLNRLIEEAK
jgi:hypothetical protein